MINTHTVLCVANNIKDKIFFNSTIYLIYQSILIRLNLFYLSSFYIAVSAPESADISSEFSIDSLVHFASAGSVDGILLFI